MTRPAPQAVTAPTPFAGRVIASYGRHLLVESAARARVSCTLFGRKLEAVCGDEVGWLPADSAGRGIVVERSPRRTVLARTDSRGRSEPLVANLTQLVVVCAGLPRADFFITDRYLVAAEVTRLASLVILNKAELPESRAVAAEVHEYARIGFATLECSAVTGLGIEELKQRLAGHVSVFVGQSGVGKSSIANRLMPGLNAETAELSRATVEGRHITSVATLHHLPSGGDLIDSPGVRDFAPAIQQLTDPLAGFPEMRQRAVHCRFADCRHLREPDCRVRSAVASGEISERRYESYRRLARLRERLSRPGTRR
jgi:ribosome biogenesis GTPase